MLGFLRRQGSGRHALGAAVTGIPSAPAPVAVPLAVAVPAPVAAPARVAVPAPAVPAPPAVPLPRVELGFRDGSTTVLPAASVQAQALLEIAGLLSGRDEANGSSTEPHRPTTEG